MISESIMMNIPANHIPATMYPVIGGVLLLTESAKSFIQLEFRDVMAWTVLVSGTGEGEFQRPVSRKKICGKPMKRNGIKGTAKSPSNRSHRLYCIRLDRQFWNSRLRSRRMPMIPLVNILHMKKCIIKAVTLMVSFFWLPGKKGA